MQLIGTIVRLQVQTRSLKVGERGAPDRLYDPSPIVAIARLDVDPDGVVGWGPTGERLDDIHNRNNPSSKYRGNNAVSVGFTSHYGAMRRRFGTHLRDGVAAENILVATGIAGGLSFQDSDLVGELVVHTSTGLVRLGQVAVAEPCVEFARFALGRASTEPEVREAVDFLRRGMRGYYLAASAAGTVELGDEVYLA